MKITPQSESFDLNNDNDQIEIAAVSASVESSAVLDAAPLVPTEDEGLRLLPAARNDDDTITSLLDRTGKQCSDFKHAIIMSPNHRDDNIDGGGGEGDGASISSLDDENENDDENNSFLLSPTLVRRQDRSSRLDSILRKLQSNPLLSTAALLMGTLTLIIWIYSSYSSSNNRFTVSNSSDDCNGKNFQHKTYPAFPAEELLGITYLHDETNQQSTSTGTLPNKSKHALNSVMLVHPPYKISDFQSNALTYWDEVVEAIEQTQRRFNDEDVDGNISYATPSKDLWTNFTTWGPCYPRPIVPRPLDNPDRDHHYLLRTHRKKRLVHNWTYIVQTFHSYNTSSYDKNVIYPMDRVISDECATRDSKKRKNGGRGGGKPPPPPLGGLCRPSFLIIGQGKCGTSSLYHYLAGHPRILPAKEKQIDYFNYHKFLPLSWYYANFPTIESFLGTGALMTGEASPGYMPYPSVVEELVKRSSSDNNWILSDPGDDGGTIVGVEEWKARVRSLPKIIAIVRNPIERAKSSYKYNYVEPAIEKLRSGSGITVRGKRIPARRSDRYYRANHLFSFEELAYAELVELKECLKAGGKGERWAFDEYDQRTDSLFYKSVRRRSNFAFTSDSPPLINLDEACYDTTKSKAVPRAQWEHLALEHENKTLALPNLHLVQSILGRGVYALPLEWWYEIFSHVHVEKELRQIHVVCTEELADTPERTMENVTNFLGLPKFDFGDVTNVGRYNVGGHRGYDTITKLHPDDDDDEHRGTVTPEDPMLLNYESLSVAIEEQQQQQQQEKEEKDPLLTISDAFLNELIHFYHPYNERLFRLIGKQCPW